MTLLLGALSLASGTITGTTLSALPCDMGIKLVSSHPTPLRPNEGFRRGPRGMRPTRFASHKWFVNCECTGVISFDRNRWDTNTKRRPATLAL